MTSTDALSQVALSVVVYHVFGIAAALLIDRWITSEREAKRETEAFLKSVGLSIILGMFLSGCNTAPIKVAPMPDVAAVRVQNETTKRHIKTFSDHNRKNIEHIDKSKEIEARADDKLQSVKQGIEELLKQP